MSISPYFDRFNPDLLPLIPPDAKVVLEVGCGTGRLAEAYRRVNPGVEWWGIENEIEAGELAASRGVEILGNDAECWSWGVNSKAQPADCLIFGDVLEHLRDPWRALKTLSSTWLKPGGQILASIPNVQHYSVILGLLRGQWRYTDEGLLDRTHLRFFTLEGIKEMFRDAGLQAFEIRGRQCGFDEAEWTEFKEWFATAPGTWDHFRAYQYIVRAIRSDVAPTRLHIHAVGDSTCCERPRLHEPLAMLGTIPGVRITTAKYPDMDLLGGTSDRIVIQQRFRFLDIGWQSRLIDSGHLLIAEIDDDPESLEGLPECDFLPLRAVHAIQTTTLRMAATCRRFNPNIMVFPNQIAELPPLCNYHGEGTAIFFGALNREADWAPIMPALNRVLADHRMVTVRVVHDKAFYDALRTPNKEFTPFCPWYEYRRILRTCDIALLPLEDTRFNRHKSDIKFLECAAEGVVALCSGEVYRQTMEEWDDLSHNCTRICGWNYDSRPGIFEHYLRGLIESTALREESRTNAYAYVRDHRLLSQHYRARHEWYVDLISRKARLDRDLLERVPELRSSRVPVQPRPAREASPA